MRAALIALWMLMLGAGTVAASPKKPAHPVQKTQGVQDWSRIVRMTPAGSFVLGNPQAAVKIVEYLSFTCPHCAHFSAESAAVLKGEMIRSGSTSYEIRPIVRDQIDLGATMLVRCAGAAGYFAAAEQIFARQDDWLPLGFNFLEKEANRFALASPLELVRAGAQSSGLIDLMRARGLSSARIDACFADQAALKRILAIADESRGKIEGTPSFFVNGEKLGVSAWATLEPVLRSKGSR